MRTTYLLWGDDNWDDVAVPEPGLLMDGDDKAVLIDVLYDHTADLMDEAGENYLEEEKFYEVLVKLLKRKNVEAEVVAIDFYALGE